MVYLPTLVSAFALAALSHAITLGTGSNYGVFAASTITNTGSSEIHGRLGLSPGSSITGFGPGTSTGQDIDNSAATTAKSNLQSCYKSLVALTVTKDLTGKDLGGQTLGPGVYGFSSSGQLTGTLTLDGKGNSDSLFVFKFGSTLTTASKSSVVLKNGAKGCNVYWQVGSSATLGTDTTFLGAVLAEASITANTGVAVSPGGLYAMTAAVTLDDNSVTPKASCGG